MTILSEATLKTLIAAGQIIDHGVAGDVRGQSYSCHAAKILPGGLGDTDQHQPAIVDWTHPAGTEVYRIQPRQLVWVRIRETVKLPDDVCAFWWQTNSLSRKGLMLVNMSMVDAGYEGSLACLFVNFGRQPVDIDPKMTVARLIFHKLDATAVPYGKGSPVEEYDRQLRDVALYGPSSFLSFQEFSSAFELEKERAFEKFKAEADKHGYEFQRTLQKSLDDAFKEKTDNLPKFLWKSYAIAGLGFLLLTSALTLTPWITDRFSLDVRKQIQSAVDSEVGRRLVPVSTIEPARTEKLELQLQELEKELRTLKQTGQGSKSQ